AERGDVLLEEVDEPALALEQGEELERRAFGRRGGLGLGRGLRLGRGLGRLGLREQSWGLRLEDARGKKAVEEDADEARPRKPEARGERERGLGLGHARRVSRPARNAERPGRRLEDQSRLKPVAARTPQLRAWLPELGSPSGWSRGNMTPRRAK